MRSADVNIRLQELNKRGLFKHAVVCLTELSKNILESVNPSVGKSILVVYDIGIAVDLANTYNIANFTT